MEYKIKEEYRGLTISKSLFGVGQISFDTSKEFTQAQLKVFREYFPNVVDIIQMEEVAESVEDLAFEGLSYNELYSYAKDVLNLEFEQKPKKQDLLERIREEVKNYMNEQ
jgi:hypothetical protein